MKRTSSKRGIAAALLALAVASSMPCGVAFADEPSAGDIAQARELFNEGMKLRDHDDAAGALEKLRAAYALAHTPIIGVELGRTYEQLGKIVEAREAYLSISRIAVATSETARSARAREEAERLATKLRPRIPTLTIHVSGVSEANVSVDGAAVPSEALAAPRPVNPGSHEIVATAAGGVTAKKTVDVAEGDSRDVELTLVAAPPPPTTAPVEPSTPTSPPPAETPSGGLSPLVYVGFAVAGAGIVAGSITGAIAMSDASKVNTACHNTLTCPTSVDGDLQSGRTMGTISTIAFIAAGAGAVAGIMGLVISHPSQEAPKTGSVEPWIGLGSAGLRGAF
jgi:hypothetical protein